MKPQFYLCGCCCKYHSPVGPATTIEQLQLLDCRSGWDSYFAEELDEKYGPFGWEEIEIDYTPT